MHRRAAIAGVFLAFICFLYYVFFLEKKELVPKFGLPELPLQSNVLPIGINLGMWNSWGAAQYSENVLMNPGFEGLIDKTVVFVEKVEEAKVILQKEIGKLNFWQGATVEGLDGWKATVVSQSDKELTLSEVVPPFEKDEPLILTKVWRGETLSKWWIPDLSKELVVADTEDRPKDSLGSQSVKLILSTYQKPEINYYLDTISEKAGKMLPIEGKWRLTFWAKGSIDGEKLRVSFQRIGRWDRKPTTFVDRLLGLTKEWKEYTLEFLGIDQGSVGPLRLHFEGVGTEGAIWLDDCYLGGAPENGFAFRESMWSLLKNLKPGVIRSGQGEGGESLANLMQPLQARKACRFCPTARSKEIQFHYGLQEFLSLVAQVNAIPWVVVPPLLTSLEIEQLISMVKELGFKRVIIEQDLSQFDVKADRFQKLVQKNAAIMKKVAGDSLVVDAIWANSPAQNSDLGLEGEAISPFFLENLNRDLSNEATMQELFKPYDPKIFKKRGVYIAKTQLATTKGDATALERNRVVSSAAAALSLGSHLVDALLNGAKAVSVHKFAGYELVVTEPVRHLPKGMDIKLFGVIRDMGSTKRVRPTGLALTLLNQAVGGDLYKIEPLNSLAKSLEDNVRILAFINEGKLSYVISSTSDKNQTIKLKGPKNVSVTLPRRQISLAYNDLFDSNEEDKRVYLKEELLKSVNGEFLVEVPPYGLSVLAF